MRGNGKGETISVKKRVRRGLNKRILSLFLAAAMLFGSADLTALATEPGVGVETPETPETSETPEQSENNQEEGAETPGNAEEETETPEAAEEGEETPGDSDEAPGEDDEDAGEPEETPGEGKDTGETTETDEPEDLDNEESVSENSISENSLIKIEGSNSLGRYFANTITTQSTMKEENTGCKVYSVDLDGTMASVSFQTLEYGTLVVGLYEEGSGKLLAAGSALVSPNDTVADVEIETDSMPQYFRLKAFLVDTDSFRPLGRVYETEDYTQKMQEFYAKTTADFASDQVLNLDEDTSNNFLVFSKDVKVICKSENADINKVIECDEENRSYKLENPDENITVLKADDIIAYYYDDNALIITKVRSMITETEGDQTVVTILGEDVDFNTVIEFIKVGAENPRSGGQSGYAAYAQTDSQYAAPWSIEDWSSTDEDGLSLNLTDIGGESSLRLFRDNKNEIERVELEISYGATASVDLKVSGEKRWKLAEPTMPTNVPGVTLSCKIEAKLEGEVIGRCKGTISGSLGVAITEDGVQNIGKDPTFTVSTGAETSAKLGIVISPMAKFLCEKILSAKLEVDGGVKVTLTIDDILYSTEEERHACKECYKVNVAPYVSIGGKIIYVWQELEVEPWEPDFEGRDGYYSVDNMEFNWDECPYKECNATATVKTTDGKIVKGATVTHKGGAHERAVGDVVTTGKEGQASIWLPVGRQIIQASYNGVTSTKTVVVDGPKKENLQLDVELEGEVERVYAGYMVTGAITKDGSLYMWGNNSVGQVGSGPTNTPRLTPIKILDNVECVSLGDFHSGAVTKDGSLYMWGSNSNGALGDGTGEMTYHQPVPVKILDNVESVSLGEGHSAAITKDGSLYMWGSNSLGEIGNGTTEDQLTPVKILDNVESVSLGYSHSGAVTKDGSLYMWGWNNGGRLGDGATEDQLNPVKILDNVESVSLGFDCSGAVTKDGSLYMWGRNDYGGVGNGTTSAQLTPIKVLDNVESVALGDYNFSGAVTKDGSLYMWGRNDYGQLGNGTTEKQLAPIKIMDNVESVSLGWDYSGAITRDGSLYMWGGNSKGFVGNGTTENQLAPVKILDNIKSVSFSRFACGAVKKTGNLYMWGPNEGRVGNGTTEQQENPVKIEFPADSRSIMSHSSEPYAEDTIQLATQADVDITGSTASFTGLKPNDIYNVYAMRSRDSENRLGSENLLYITQAVSDGSGNLSVSYELREDCENPDIFCVGYTRTDLSPAQVSVPNIDYDGEEHLAEPTVVLDGQTLTEGTDYAVYGPCIVTEKGEYTLQIRGIGSYCGTKEVTFRVGEGDDPKEDDPKEEDPEPDDVLPGDIPSDGLIPDGLWIAGVNENGYSYTGKAIKPEVRVYDHKRLLVEKVDYTIAYKNNTKASDASVEKTAPTITVTGKGNYSGKDTKTFKILPLDISQSTEDNLFEADDMAVASSKKAQKPVPALLWNGKKLKNKTDYTFTYHKGTYNGTETEELVSVKDAGEYYITLTGKGNFAGTRRIRLTVLPTATDEASVKLISKTTVAKIPNQSYLALRDNGQVTPEVTVKDGKTTLTKDVHYTVSYSNNGKVGAAYAIITGREEGGYSGTKRVSFMITGVSISKAAVEGLSGQTFTYNGADIKPQLKLTVNLNGVSTELKEGTDYSAQWTNVSDAGTAAVVFTGINGYTGTLKKTYKIKAYNIAQNQSGLFKAELKSESVPYAKGGAKPQLNVTFRRADGSALSLKEGKDYTVAYRNNTAYNDGSNANKRAYVTVKGKGNFAGTYAEKLYYQITAQDIGKMTLTAEDKAYQNKKNYYATKVTVTDLDGKTLKAGTDYDKSLAYTYRDDTTLDNGVSRKAGESVDKNDVIPAGTVIKVTATPKGRNYTGTSVSGEYSVKPGSISGASVSIPKQTYTGRAITLKKEDITVKVKGKKLEPSQYEIVPGSYQNNVKKGTATVTIRGTDNYGGTKKAKFTIRAKGFLWWWKK